MPAELTKGEKKELEKRAAIDEEIRFRLWRDDTLRQIPGYYPLDRDDLRALISSRGKDKRGGHFWLRLAIRGCIGYGLSYDFIAEALGEPVERVRELNRAGVWREPSEEDLAQLAGIAPEYPAPPPFQSPAERQKWEAARGAPKIQASAEERALMERARQKLTASRPGMNP